MDNLGRITGGASVQRNVSAGKYKSVSSKDSSGVKDSFSPTKGAGADSLMKADAVKKMKSSKTAKAPKADLARLFTPGDDGKYVRTTKISCGSSKAITSFTDNKGKKHLVFPAAGLGSIMMISDDGTPEFQIKIPEKEMAARFEFSPKNNTLYVRTGEGLHGINPSTGKVENSFSFGSYGHDKKFLLDGKGKILLTVDNELKVLDKNLKEESSETIGFRPDELRFLSNGALMAYDDASNASLLIRDAKGKTLINENSLKLHSLVTGDDGSLFAVNETVSKDGKHYGKEVIRYNQSTGEVSRFSVSKKVKSVIPLKDGGFIAFEDELSHPRLVGYDKDGDAKWNTSFDKEGFLRQTYLSEDEKELYLVHTSHDENNKNRSTGTLYRVNLESRGTLMGKAMDAFFSTGKSLTPRKIHSAEGDNRSMLPMVLDDKRIVAFEKDAIRLLGPSGKEQKTYKSIDELKKELPDTARVISKGVYTSYTANGPLDADVDTVMKAAVGTYKGSSSVMYEGKSLKTGVKKGNGDFQEDMTIGFTKEVDEKNLFEAIGAKDAAELKAMSGDSYLVNFALSQKMDLPIKNGSVERLEVKKDHVLIKYDPSLNQPDRSLNVPGSIFTTILPVKIGDSNRLYGATNDGMFHCFDLDTGETLQPYSLGSPAKSIRVVGGDKIVAVTANGGFFSLKPLLKKGEKMEGELKLTKMNMAVDTGEEAEDEKVVIDKDTRVVNIGGVQLPIQGRKDFYIS